jgi:hypothetical protein
MSDPSAMNIPVHQALTSDMLLGLKPSAPKSRSYRRSIAPINKSVFNPGDQIIFEFPTGRKGTWLDQSQSYLKFSVQFAATAAVAVGGSGIYLDNSAYSFIQRMDIYNSSNLLETINEYGQLTNFLMDTSLTISDKAGLSTLIGTNPTNATYMNMTSAAAVFAGAATTFVGATTQPQVAGDRSGLSVTAANGAGAIGGAIPYTFSLPLLSGIIGINASKMLPVGKLHAPIRVEMYLSANDDAIYYGTGGLGAIWQIVNVEFCACYVEIQDDSLDTNPAPGEQEYISTTTYRQASTYMPAATSGEFTTLLPFRAASITALYARFRPFGTAVQGANGTAAYRKGASINPNLSFYYFRIGSSVYPNKPVYLTNGSLVGTGAEAYGELLKSFHALSSTIGNTALTYNSYNVAATATQGFALNYVPGSKSLAATTAVAATGVVPPIDTHGNAFAIGLECQSFSNRNDTILSGISTLNSQIYFTGGIANGLTAGGVANNYNYTIDFFSQMDMVLVMQDGILSAKF